MHRTPPKQWPYSLWPPPVPARATADIAIVVFFVADVATVTYVFGIALLPHQQPLFLYPHHHHDLLADLLYSSSFSGWTALM